MFVETEFAEMAMADIEVTYDRGDRFAIDVRRHRVIVDQPFESGGDDAGPTPTELFASALASCVAFYAMRYLRRHSLSSDGLRVTCDFTMASEAPARVETMTIKIVTPDGFPQRRSEALLRVASHCTVHNSITATPAIDITVQTRHPGALMVLRGQG